MKLHIIILSWSLIGLLICSDLSAQFNNNYWLFGDSVGINWTSPSNPSFFNSKVRGRGTSVSIADSSGVLIYSHSNYTTFLFNQSKTYNRFNIPIPGSDSLYVEGWYHEMLLIPHPGNNSLVYLFTIGVNSFDGLYYTLINYKANNDSGIVIQKNIQLQNAPAFDGLTAVRHGNGRDWWVLFKIWDGTGQSGNNLTYVYVINPNGISLNSTQSIGPISTSGGGQFVFSGANNKLMHVNWRGLILLFNFDRCTGLLSAPITIEAERSGNPYPYYFSSAFSSDGSKLYVVSISPSNQPGQNDTLFQFDLTAPNISASKQVISVLPSYERTAGNLKLAPDNKIYLTSGDQTAGTPYPDTLFTTINSYLSVINYPDSLGLACDFQPFSFYLGGARTYYGLPNNPDYELGAWVGSPCDTLTVGITENGEKDDVFFQAWYNPEWNMIHVNASKLKGKSGVLRLFDVEGRVVVERKVDVIKGGYFTGEIGMNGILAGVYIVSLTTEKDKVQSKIMKY
jgi:hypothetical protein